jgi:hypothetical protein
MKKNKKGKKVCVCLSFGRWKWNVCSQHSRLLFATQQQVNDGRGKWGGGGVRTKVSHRKANERASASEASSRMAVVVEKWSKKKWWGGWKKSKNRQYHHCASTTATTDDGKGRGMLRKSMQYVQIYLLYIVMSVKTVCRSPLRRSLSSSFFSAAAAERRWWLAELGAVEQRLFFDGYFCARITCAYRAIHLHVHIHILSWWELERESMKAN